MTRSIFNPAKLLESNLDTYEEYLKQYENEYKEKNKLEGVFIDGEIFFRYFIYYFLDKDEEYFDNFISSAGKEFYEFFSDIALLNSLEEPDRAVVADVTEYFTRLYQNDNQRDNRNFHNVVWFIQCLNERRCVMNGNGSHVHVSPWNRFEGKRIRSYFKFFLEMFYCFKERTESVHVLDWIAVFDVFLKKYPKLNFLNIMEMTEEYFERLARSAVQTAVQNASGDGVE